MDTEEVYVHNVCGGPFAISKRREVEPDEPAIVRGVVVFVGVTPGKSNGDVWNMLTQCAMVGM